jgi:hypothetical protein
MQSVCSVPQSLEQILLKLLAAAEAQNVVDARVHSPPGGQMELDLGCTVP